MGRSAFTPLVVFLMDVDASTVPRTTHLASDGDYLKVLLNMAIQFFSYFLVKIILSLGKIFSIS